MNRVIGIDPSLVRTGVADVHGNLHSIRTGKRRDVERLAFIEGELIPFILQADLVVIEGQSYNAKGRSHFSLAELHGILHLSCHKAHTKTLVVPPATLKKASVGKGNATKDEMLLAALDNGADAANHDEADAWWLRQYGLKV